MTQFVLRRLAVAIPLLLVVATISFFLVQLVPGSVAAAILGNNATQEQVDTLQHSLGLDQPVLAQFGSWLGHALQGDLGASYTTGQSVSEALGQSLAPTLSLAILSTLVTLAEALARGMAAAVRGGRTARLVQWTGRLGMEIPSSWRAARLIFVFALKFSVFPAAGY